MKSFLPLFAMTFFIVLFIVLMQFLWRYIDDLVGKGLAISVIGELFFYAAVSMVPMALPLAILLASLMTFGNLGERFELTAMKAAGISLLKVMAPLIVLISGIAVGAFFFQNDILPKAQVKMWTLLFSMRQKNPEVEIPVGVFYDQIPGINLYVSAKDRNDGMLYDVKIYDVRHGGENVTILVSDSAYMAMTQDMQYIYLYMYKGNQYERMAPNSTMKNDPFRRESFHTKEILIPFDNNFNRMDEQGMREQYVGKNIRQLQNTIDSVNLLVDSLGRTNAVTLARQNFATTSSLANKDMKSQTPEWAEAAEKARKEAEERRMKQAVVDFDSVMATLNPSAYNNVVAAAIRDAGQKRNSFQFENETVAREKKIIRRHGIELIKKFTLSVACIIFFFIGAPLGAIIRKGGLGMPLVISVLLFLVYYIIDNTGYKMARDGHAEVWFGMWLSTMILAPLGVFVTYKAMNDSAVFDPDRIKIFFRRLIGRKEERNLALKEVIINDIIDREACRRLKETDGACRRLLSELKGKRLLAGKEAARKARLIMEKVDDITEYLHDSRDIKVIDLINDYPVYNPSRFTPVVRLRRRLKQIMEIDGRIAGLLDLDISADRLLTERLGSRSQSAPADTNLTMITTTSAAKEEKPAEEGKKEDENTEKNPEGSSGGGSRPDRRDGEDGAVGNDGADGADGLQ